MKKIKLILIIIWMIVIFMFSNQPSDESSNLSNNFINNTIVKVYELTHGEISIEKREEILNKYSYPVRKLAHFTVYFILGLLSIIYFNDINKKYIIYTILLCFVYACSDEFHQYFVPGRYCTFIDVLIDTFGGIFSIIFSRIFIYKKNKNMI